MTINRRTDLTGTVAGTQDVNRFSQLISQIDVAENELREIIEVHKYKQYYDWYDPASTPIEDVRGALRMFEKLFGVRANDVTLTISPETFDSLCDHPDIIDRVQYGSGQNFSHYQIRPSFERMGEAIARMVGVKVAVRQVRPYEIPEIDTGAVKTLWFDKVPDAFLIYYDWDELGKYYDSVKHDTL